MEGVRKNGSRTRPVGQGDSQEGNNGGSEPSGRHDKEVVQEQKDPLSFSMVTFINPGVWLIVYGEMSLYL